MMIKCPYCGNTSGLKDSVGGCISCGGQNQPIAIQPPVVSTYDGVSGSSYYLEGIRLGIIPPKEVRTQFRLPPEFENKYIESVKIAFGDDYFEEFYPNV